MKLQLPSITVLVFSSIAVLGAVAGCGGAPAAGAHAKTATGPAGAKSAAAPAPNVGGEAHPLLGAVGPNFAAASVNGKGRAAVNANPGKVLIVDFWATWCEPCKKSFPKLEELYVKYHASGMDIVAVSEDDANDGLTGFGNTYGAKFPLVWDDGKAIATKWQPRSMPSTFVVDKRGVVRYVHLGYHDGEEAAIEREVKSLL
jgi:peroxiredoxin